MKEVSNEYVIYEPTKSVSFGHQAREKDARKAWAQVEAFLQKWTVSTLHESITFQCVPPYEGSVKIYNEYRAHANQILGTEGEGLWHFSPSELPKALALAFDEEKWPRQKGGGPAYLRFSYDFEWSTPTPPVPSLLQRTSSFAITISGKRVFIQSRLIFPWPVESGVSQTLVSAMAHDTPVLLHDAYFKRMIPTKTDGYRVLRFTKNHEVA